MIQRENERVQADEMAGAGKGTAAIVLRKASGM